MENTGSNNNIEIGALWKKEGKSQKFLSGKINLKEVGYDKDVDVIVFTNKSKKSDRHPDLRIYLSRPRVEGSAPQGVAKTQKQSAASKPAQRQVVEQDSDEGII